MHACVKGFKMCIKLLFDYMQYSCHLLMRVCNGENFSSSKYKTNTEDGFNSSVIESYKTS